MICDLAIFVQVLHFWPIGKTFPFPCIGCIYEFTKTQFLQFCNLTKVMEVSNSHLSLLLIGFMSTTISAIVDVCRQNPKFAFSGSICNSLPPIPSLAWFCVHCANCLHCKKALASHFKDFYLSKWCIIAHQNIGTDFFPVSQANNVSCTEVG